MHWQNFIIIKMQWNATIVLETKVLRNLGLKKNRPIIVDNSLKKIKNANYLLQNMLQPKIKAMWKKSQILFIFHWINLHATL